MRYNSGKFIKKVVEFYMNDRGAKRRHTAKEYEEMLNDVFIMLADKMLDGYVIKAPKDLGVFSVKTIHNYVVSKKNVCAINTKSNRYFSDIYFVEFEPGNHKSMMYYTFRMSDGMRDKISKQIKSGNKIFAFEKERER